jgi:hypothetical protein
MGSFKLNHDYTRKIVGLLVSVAAIPLNNPIVYSSIRIELVLEISSYRAIKNYYWLLL